MERINTMYFNMISAITGVIKEELGITNLGSLRIGSANGFYVTSTFEVPIQKLSRMNMTLVIAEEIKKLPICFLGIIKEVLIDYQIKEGETFGDMSIHICVTVVPDGEHLRFNAENKNLLEVVKEYEGKKVLIKQL